MKIKTICLNLTDRCNFNCKYCFVKQKPNSMSFKVADDTIKWLLQNNTEEELTVIFFGGEPTLEWDNIIVPLVNKYPKIKYSITTNGYLLNKEKIDFLAKNNFSVLLSMDGAETTQNYNRKENSFKKLDNIIPYLIDNIQYNGLRGTIIPATCHHTFENILYAQNKKFNQCYFTINIFENWSEQDKKKLELEIKKYALAYVNSFVNNYSLINFTPFTDMVKLLIKKEIDILDNNININKCGLGNNYAAINYKGDIFTCQEIVTNEENNELFKIGNIYTGIDLNKINVLQELIINDLPIENNENKNNCKNCPLIFCCKKNTCQINNYICNKNCLIQSSNQCWWNLLLYKAVVWTISILQTLPNFQEYMKTFLEKEV